MSLLPPAAKLLRASNMRSCESSELAFLNALTRSSSAWDRLPALQILEHTFVRLLVRPTCSSNHRLSTSNDRSAPLFAVPAKHRKSALDCGQVGQMKLVVKHL